MSFCTGRCMCHAGFAAPFAAEDVMAMVDRLFEDRVRFRETTDTLYPGSPSIGSAGILTACRSSA